MMLSSRKKLVNLEIKDYVIRYVDAKRGLQSKSMVIDEVYIPPGVIKNGMIIDPKTFQVIFRSCVTKWGLKRKAVRFLVPDSYVVIRKQFVPAEISKEELRGYIFFELGRSIHLPFENPTFDYQVVGETDGKTEIVIFAAPEDLVNSYVHLFESLKLRPEVADISSLSLYRLYTYLEKPPADEELLLIKLDTLDSSLTIFKGDIPIFMQHQHFEYEASVEVTDAGVTLPFEVAIPAVEEWMEEIDRILHFYRYSFTAGNGAIGKAVLTGDHPFLQDIYDMLQQRFSFAALYMHYPSDLEEMHPKYYSSLGLALKGVQL